MDIMKRIRLGAILAVALSVFAAAPVFAAAVIGQSLKAELGALAPGGTVEIIVSFEGDGPLDNAELAALEAVGVNGIYFQALPMAGVVATAAQAEKLANVAGVRSLWLNEELAYTNDGGRAVTGVDRMRTDPNLRNAIGLPFSGKGVGVMINDSGIDATHPDLQLGPKTVQNVLGTTNLHAVDSLLPITWVEGVPDTDIGSGHGTHVSGTIGGTGAASGGKYAGVAPGANLVGYGSGAVIFILDTIGGFDYALVNQFRYNIRVINNSWGSPGDTGTPFNPDDPINIATKKLADRNVIVVFAAGNSGSGEDTIGGNFIKAPWVVRAGAGNKDGTLADFSSRGKRDGGGTAVVDGETFTWVDRPTVVAPGVDIISTLANTGALGLLEPENADYAHMSGTSMACPHTVGIIALMLEANPRLGWPEVKKILEDTATNMPGRDDWEVGAGYVNAYAAVTTAAGARDDFGAVQTLNRTFNAEVHESRIEGPDFALDFNPVLDTPPQSFTVAAGLSTVAASAVVDDNTVAIVLRDPDGNRFGSAISLPLLGPSIAVTAPARPGLWTVEIRGIGSVSGVVLDPLGLTNGTAVPGTVNVDVSFFRVDGFTGLNDIAGHPAQGFIERAVAERLLDARSGGLFDPGAALTRGELADYLTQGAGVRQFLPTGGGASFNDTLAGLEEAAAEAVTARGAAIRDLRQVQKGVVKPAGSGQYNPDGFITRAEMAFTLVQALGLETQAEAARAALEDEPITVAFKDERVALDDDASVPAALRGYVQLALDFQLMRAAFSLEQGPFDLQPTIKARFNPATGLDRANYAFSAVNLFDRLSQGE